MEHSEVGTFDEEGKPLNMEEIVQSRENNGICPLCGVTKIRKMKASFSKGIHMAPITKDGEAYKGFCVICFTEEEILTEIAKQKEEKRMKTMKGKPSLTTGQHLQGSIDGNGYEAIHLNNKSAFADKNKQGKNERDRLKSILTSFDFDSVDSTSERSRNDNSRFAELKSLATASTDNSDLREIDSMIEKIVKHSNSATKVASFYDQLADLHVTRRKVRPNAIDVVLDAMANHIRNTDVQHRGCRALRTLTTTGKHCDSVGFFEVMKYCDRIENHHGGISTIIAAMTSNTLSLPVQQEAMHVIINIIRVSVTSRNVILKSQGVKAFIRAMWSFDEPSCLQEWGCYLLHKLAHNNSSAQVTIVENDGIMTILKAMHYHSPVERVQIYGCAALNSLLSPEKLIAQDIMDKDGLDIILNTLTEHVGREKLTASAMELIAKIAVLAKGSCFAEYFYSDCSAIDCVNNSMRTHAKSLAIQRNACLLVEIIAQSLSSTMVFSQCPNLRFSLLDAAKEFPSHCRGPVDQVLKTINEI